MRGGRLWSRLRRMEDAALLARGARLRIGGLLRAVREGDAVGVSVAGKGARIEARLRLAGRQRKILLAGGLLNYIRTRGK